VLYVEAYGGMSSSPSVRLVAPSASHPPMTVRPSPTVRPLSNTASTMRLVPSASAAAVAMSTSQPAVSMPTAPMLKRKREDDDDYNLM